VARCIAVAGFPVVGGVVVCVHIVVVRWETMRPRATIIRVEDSEVNHLLTHRAFGVAGPSHIFKIVTFSKFRAFFWNCASCGFNQWINSNSFGANLDWKSLRSCFLHRGCRARSCKAILLLHIIRMRSQILGGSSLVAVYSEANNFLESLGHFWPRINQLFN